MKSSIKIIIAAVVIVAALVGGLFLFKHISKNYSASSNTENASSSLESVNHAAMDFTVYDGDGKAVSLSSLKGKSVVVNFWADWCPPCVSELPHFQKAYKEYDDVVFMMVNIDSTPDYIKPFLDKQGYDFPVYYDSDSSASDAYGLSTIPRTIFVNPEGELVKTQIGMIDETTLNETIERIRG